MRRQTADKGVKRGTERWVKKGTWGYVWEYIGLLAANPMKIEEMEQKVIPLAMGAENHITKIKLFKRGIEWQCPGPKAAVGFLEGWASPAIHRWKACSEGVRRTLPSPEPVPRGLTQLGLLCIRTKQRPFREGKTQAKAGTS